MGRVGRVTWVDYTEHGELGLVARVSCRMEDESKENYYFTDIEPWGFVHEDEELPDRDWVVDVEYGYESLFDDPLKKVITSVPSKVNSRNDNDVLTSYVDQHFESDLPMYRKLAAIDGISGYIDLPESEKEVGGINVVSFEDANVDIDYQGLIEPRVMIGDIEVSIGDETFEETQENNTQPINVICSYDSHKKDLSVFFYNKFESLSNLEEIRKTIEEQWSVESDHDSLPIELNIASTEEEMLNDFMNYLNNRSFDLTSGWNWSDFDWEYITGRMERLDSGVCGTCGEETLYNQKEDAYYCPIHGTNTSVDKNRMSPFGKSAYSNNNQMITRGLPSFDMMTAFADKMTFSNWRSKSLDYISNEELDIGKIEEVDINDDWENNPERLISYNIIDVLLTVALDDKNDIHGFFYEMSDVCSIPIYDVFYEMRQVDGRVLSRRNKDEILPSVDESNLVENAGGYVDDAINGIKESVGVVDLKSLYPSDIITWNLSTETVSESPEDFDNYVKIPKVPEPKNVRGEIKESQIEWDWLYASLDEEGLIPRTTKKLFKKRNYEKEQMYAAEEGSDEQEKWDRKQGATKVIMNSVYGNLSSKYYRLSNEYLGDAVTSAARYTLWKGKQTLDRIDYEHVYSDTDSHFLQLTEDTVSERVEELKSVASELDKDASKIAADIGIKGQHPFLDGHLHGDKYTCLMWEPEKVYSKYLQLGKKKRYAGNREWKEGTIYDEPNISISGFENQRSDSMPVSADLQEEVLGMVLTETSFKEVSDYINSLIDQIDEDREDVRKFALPGSINKDLEDYPNRQIPRACMWSNEHLDREFSEGDDPFVYLVEETPAQLPHTDVVALEWNEPIPDGFKLDKEAIIERGIRKPIDPIINEMGWTFSEVRSGRQTAESEVDLSGSGANPFA